jgi:hypothetical protein
VTTADAVLLIIVIVRHGLTPDGTAVDWARQEGDRRRNPFIPARAK